jgi:hypothetical protein
MTLNNCVFLSHCGYFSIKKFTVLPVLMTATLLKTRQVKTSLLSKLVLRCAMLGTVKMAKRKISWA